MTEAVDPLVGALFRFTDLDQVTAHIRLDNGASRRVLEKCGFAQIDERVMEAPARGRSFDWAIYARPREGVALRTARQGDWRRGAR